MARHDLAVLTTSRADFLDRRLHALCIPLAGYAKVDTQISRAHIQAIDTGGRSNLVRNGNGAVRPQSNDLQWAR